MQRSHERWLLEHLPAWQREGLVTATAAATLRDRYHAEHRPAVACGDHLLPLRRAPYESLAILAEFAGRQGAARLRAGLITILVLLRMADADLALLAKGGAFIVIGALFLAFNAFVSRRRAAIPGAVS